MLKKKLPAYVKILIGMVIGLLVGLLAVNINGSQFIINWIKPFGDIFIRLLMMVAAPLILVSLILGFGGLNDLSKLSSLGLKTIGLYIATTLIAITLGVSLAYIVNPGGMISETTSEAMTSAYSESMASNMTNLETIEQQSPLKPIVDIFPSNAFHAMTDNGAMLQIILLASLIGIAVIMIGKEKSEPFMKVISSLNDIILKIIDIIMSFAPIGVAALMAGLVVDSAGDISLLTALGMYALTVVIALFLLMLGFYPLLIKLFTKIKPSKFIKALIPVQLVAFSTSSSAATLSTTMKVADNVLKLPKSVTSFTLPIGVTINMDGTSCYQAIAIIFIAQVMGVDLSFAQILTVIGTTTLASIGTPGIPGGSIVISMMVLSAIGIPPEGLVLILGIDRPLDMLRTAVNVTGDTVISAIISRKTMANSQS